MISVTRGMGLMQKNADTYKVMVGSFTPNKESFESSSERYKKIFRVIAEISSGPYLMGSFIVFCDISALVKVMSKYLPSNGVTSTNRVNCAGT